MDGSSLCCPSWVGTNPTPWADGIVVVMPRTSGKGGGAGAGDPPRAGADPPPPHGVPAIRAVFLVAAPVDVVAAASFQVSHGASWRVSSPGR
jgi:hypothetical protein